MTKASKLLLRLLDEDNVLTLVDRLEAPTERTFKDTGQMIAPATLARVGVMEYLAKDCGPMFADRDPNSIVKINTSAEELFDEDTLASARSAPITVGHPAEDVTTENAKDLMVGQLEGMPFKDGDNLSATLALNDADSIAIVKDSADQLSIGQNCSLKLADEGSGWDAEKIGIRINHVAIVKKGRAKTARISDEDSVQDKLDAAQANIDILTQKLEDAATKIATLEQEKVSLVDQADQELSDKIEARIELITEARMLDKDIETKGKDSATIQLEAVSKSYSGSQDLSTKSAAYVAVLFDQAVEAAKEVGKPSEVQKILDEALEKQKLVDKESAKPNPAAESRNKMIQRHSHKKEH